MGHCEPLAHGGTAQPTPCAPIGMESSQFTETATLAADDGADDDDIGNRYSNNGKHDVAYFNEIVVRTHLPVTFFLRFCRFDRVGKVCCAQRVQFSSTIVSSTAAQSSTMKSIIEMKNSIKSKIYFFLLFLMAHIRPAKSSWM